LQRDKQGENPYCLIQFVALPFFRIRFVLPLEAGIGQTPQSFARAASERNRSGLTAAQAIRGCTQSENPEGGMHGLCRQPSG